MSLKECVGHWNNSQNSKLQMKTTSKWNFFATEESLWDNFIGKRGVFIYLFEDGGGLGNDDFKSSPKPEKLEAESVRDHSIDPHWSKNNIKKYNVSTKKLKMSALTGSVSIQCVVTKLTKGLPYLGLMLLPGTCSKYV